MPSLSSPLQTFCLSPPLSPPALLPPPSEPNFHNFQLVRSRREGKQRNRGRAKTLGGRIWELTEWLGGLFYCGW